MRDEAHLRDRRRTDRGVERAAIIARRDGDAREHNDMLPLALALGDRDFARDYNEDARASTLEEPEAGVCRGGAACRRG